jgi:nucleoside-diphosphate-sugar epimerase
MTAGKNTHTNEATIILAGATGDLGGRIAHALRERGARVKALIRPGSAGPKVAALRERGVETVAVDMADARALAAACAGGTCLVSALSGLRETVVDAQTALLEAARAASVPRFIPSDYAIDFTKLPPGTNRNLDLRREFGERLDQAPLAATSVLCGMFADLLTGPAPVVLFPLKRVVYWGDADQPLDFTTIDNTAAFTAAAALDPATPRYLRIAGEAVSARELVRAAGEATGNEFRLLRAGSLRRLGILTRFTRALAPGRREVFPAWQGMQYLHNMFSGLPKLAPLDNDRYAGIRWTPVGEVLAWGRGRSD